MLDRSTDRRSRCGTAVVNLAHSASFYSRVKNAPSNPGIKHLVPDTLTARGNDLASEADP
jgi:hypothetical protein